MSYALCYNGLGGNSAIMQFVNHVSDKKILQTHKYA